MDVETGVAPLPKQMQPQERRKSTISLCKITADHPALKGCDEKTISTILSELAKVDVNNDGLLDTNEVVTLAKNCIQRATADSKKINSQRRTIFGLTVGTIFLCLAVFGLTAGAVFIAKDTSVSSSNVLTTRSGQPVRTELKSNDFVAFAPDAVSPVDKDETFTAEATDLAATPSPGMAKSLGCVKGEDVPLMAQKSVRSTVVLTAPDGSLHKIDGHDIEWNEDGGATIVESSGMVYKIKRDPSCASASDRRRLANTSYSLYSVEVVGNICELTLSDKDDSMTGTAADDIIRGGAGNDRLGGEDGNDELHGGDGNDELHGGDGNDELRGGDGNDRLYGEDGNDRLSGYFGNDVLVGGDGNDELRGRSGMDTAIFTGDWESYDFALNEGNLGLLWVEVSHDGKEVDTLHGIETLEFADATCTVASSNGNETDENYFISSKLYSLEDGCDKSGQTLLEGTAYQGTMHVCITCE